MTKGIGHVSSVDGLLSPVGETCEKRGLDCGKTVGGRNVKPDVLLFQLFSLKAEARAQRTGGFSVPPVTVSSVVRTLPPAASSSCEIRVAYKRTRVQLKLPRAVRGTCTADCRLSLCRYFVHVLQIASLIFPKC